MRFRRCSTFCLGLFGALLLEGCGNSARGQAILSYDLICNACCAGNHYASDVVTEDGEMISCGKQNERPITKPGIAMCTRTCTEICPIRPVKGTRSHDIALDVYNNCGRGARYVGKLVDLSQPGVAIIHSGDEKAANDDGDGREGDSSGGNKE